MSYSEQVRKDAKAAADYIREHGWCQGEFVNKKGACCMAGARNAVTIGNPQGTHSPYLKDGATRELALREAVNNELFDTWTVPWNDTPGRTKEEVLEVFDRIANSDKQ